VPSLKKFSKKFSNADPDGNWLPGGWSIFCFTDHPEEMAMSEKELAALQEQHVALKEQHAALQDEYNEAVNKITGLEAVMTLRESLAKEINRQVIEVKQENRALRQKNAQIAECYRHQLDELWADMSVQLNYARSRIAGLEARLGLNKGNGDGQSQALERVPRNMPLI
jgi:chromosome segregation ATPase